MLWLHLVRHSGEREPSCRGTWSRQADCGLEFHRLSHLSTQHLAVWLVLLVGPVIAGSHIVALLWDRS